MKTPEFINQILDKIENKEDLDIKDLQIIEIGLFLYATQDEIFTCALGLSEKPEFNCRYTLKNPEINKK